MSVPTSSETQPSDLVLTYVESEQQLPPSVSLDDLSTFLNVYMKPYQDELPDVRRGLEDALSINPGAGGFLVVATSKERLLGAVVMRGTGMKGYVPELLLLFVCVHPDLRGQGIGEKLIRMVFDHAGDRHIKLHVDFDNPAQRLYKRLGFKAKYTEMRYAK